MLPLNGAVYVAKCDWLLINKKFLTSETIAYEMPKERSIDIDTEFDFRVAETILNFHNLISCEPPSDINDICISSDGGCFMSINNPVGGSVILEEIAGQFLSQ